VRPPIQLRAVPVNHAHNHREAQKRALRTSLVANGVLLIVEVVAGLALGSLALLADAAHMMSDVAALGVALGAQRLLDVPASSRHTYGLQRAEVLAAQFNGLVLVVAAGWIVYEAVGRLGDAPEIDGGGLALVASLGLIVNLVSARLLFVVRGDSLNMRGAYLHMMLDSVGSIGALGAGLGALWWGAYWADPIIAIAIAGLVLWSAWQLLRDTTQVLLEGAPRGMDASEVADALASDAAVETIHHLHLWNLASDVPALSAHIVLVRASSLHDAQIEGERLKEMLHERFGIAHSTLELECHVCDPVHEGTT
jgi:cobalt-zinc-cadmium efflux system protein